MRCAYLLAAALTIAGALPARGEILRFFSNGNEQFLDFDAPESFVLDLLEEAGDQPSPKFVLSKPGRVLITFIAECGFGGDPADIDVDIEVRPGGAGNYVKLKPTDGDGVFCSFQNSANNGVAAGSIKLKAGTYQVRVRVNGTKSGIAGLSTVTIDDLSLSVQN